MEQLEIIATKEVFERDFNIYGSIEEPLFLAKDISEVIGHSNISLMLRSLDEDEKVINKVYTPGGYQDSWFITENGLYELLMVSRKPIAKDFKKKVKQILKDLRLNKVSLINNTNDTEKDKQINDLINTLNNVVEQNNIMLKMIMENNRVTNNNQSEENKIIPKDNIEIEILNFNEEFIKLQDFCTYLNDKNVLMKTIGTKTVYKLLRDRGIFTEGNTPTYEYNKYFSIIKDTEGIKYFITKEGMIILYRIAKEDLTSDYKVFDKR